MSVNLRTYDNSWYSPGRSKTWRAAWMFVGQPIFRSSLLGLSRLRVALLRMFGAEIGDRVVIRAGVQVKYPWHLVIGHDCWIGQDVWIDNLTTVRIGSNVCVSQAAYLCTGNHDWTDPGFGLKIASIELKDAAWAGAKSLLLPGVILHEGAVASAGSVVGRPIPAWEIHSGNPAVFLRRRTLRVQGAEEKQEF